MTSDSLLAGAEALKRAAAARALDEVSSGMRLGLGTGSTVAHFLDLLGEALASGRLADVVGVPTSEWTAGRARELGISLTTLEQTPELDLCVDGADEVDPSMDLVKGLGGALLREKIVAGAARRFVVMVDASKEVERLGTRAPLPVEVVPFGWTVHRRAMEELGAHPVLRSHRDEMPFLTDNGNFIVDLHFRSGIDDPRGVEETLRRRAGIVDTGLFLGMASLVVVAAPEGIRVRSREVTT
jgi:ribose 5-phosphate isomerase A